MFTALLTALSNAVKEDERGDANALVLTIRWVGAAAGAMVHGSTHVLGVGLKGPRPEALATKCWMYFPEPDSPYYRVTVFSNYSPNNVPPGDRIWSLMAEVCESPAKPVTAATLADDTIAAMRRDGLIPEGCSVVSVWHHRADHG